MDIRAGTSGFSYKEWKGPFYPEKLPAKDMLAHYGTRLPTVEINNTFYRLPKPGVLATWASQVPDDFRFAIKASRRITHLKRLKDVADETQYLLNTIQTLETKLGAILFQLPPNFKADVPRLEAFLELLPGGTRAAFEFRHPSWFEDPVFELLRARDVPLVVADTDDDDEDATIVSTASWGYLRLRRPGYTDDALARWTTHVSAIDAWKEAYVFFKHEDEADGPRMAEAFCAAGG